MISSLKDERYSNPLRCVFADSSRSEKARWWRLSPYYCEKRVVYNPDRPLVEVLYPRGHKVLSPLPDVPSWRGRFLAKWVDARSGEYTSGPQWKPYCLRSISRANLLYNPFVSQRYSSQQSEPTMCVTRSSLPRRHVTAVKQGKVYCTHQNTELLVTSGNSRSRSTRLVRTDEATSRRRSWRIQKMYSAWSIVNFIGSNVITEMTLSVEAI